MVSVVISVCHPVISHTVLLIQIRADIYELPKRIFIKIADVRGINDIPTESVCAGFIFEPDTTADVSFTFGPPVDGVAYCLLARFHNSQLSRFTPILYTTAAHSYWCNAVQHFHNGDTLGRIPQGYIWNGRRCSIPT